jgi:short-subunit dehydrogenase
LSWDLAGGVAVVTGAASGIGRALAWRLAAERMSLALGDIDPSALEESAGKARATGVTVTTHVVDVSRAERVEQFAAEVVRAHQRVTLLVNNAGVALHGRFEELSVQEFDWLMRINFWGVVYGTKAFLAALEREPRSHVVNLSSIFGIIAPPGQTAYSASKFAIRGFSEALRHELQGTSIGVSWVCPGGVRTGIAARARVAAGAKASAEPLLARFDQLARHSPEFAARKIVRGVKRNRPRILVGADAHLLDAVQRLFPARYWDLMSRGRGAS